MILSDVPYMHKYMRHTFYKQTEVRYFMKLTVLAPAKLNLFLDITGKRNDGYHIVNMVMQSISLYDEVTVSVNNSDKILISCSDNNIPCDKNNTVYKAAEKFFEYNELEPEGVTIKIKKRIPSQAGMAGGSTDAAAVLTAMNELFDTGLEKEELAQIAEEIGADVPFCIYGGTMTAGGIGTILNPLPDMPECFFVVVKPAFSISTKDAYEKSDSIGYEKSVSADDVVNGICNGSLEEIAEGLYNKFEEVAGINEIDDIKYLMESCGALGACLTGSGSAVFGIFDNRDEADECFDHLSSRYDQVFIAEPVFDGQVFK